MHVGVLGWMSVCMTREGTCLCVPIFTRVRICVNVCDSLSVCVIRVKKWGYLCHFGQSGKGRHYVCNLYIQGEDACSRGEHKEVCSGAVLVCVCAAGEGERLAPRCTGVWARVHLCRLQRAWPCSGLRACPAEVVQVQVSGTETKESPLLPPSLLVQGHSPCPGLFWNSQQPSPLEETGLASTS